MDEERPFVGRHTPRIALAGGKHGGMVQRGLALRKGKQYVGRIWLAGSAEAAPATVSLRWGVGPEQRQAVTIAKLGGEFVKTPLQFTAGGDSDDGRLEIVAAGAGTLRVGAVSLMPADNVQGMRADTLALLEQLNAPIYRWPGGNFASGYDWHDGLGDPDRRPPRKNPAWKGIEHNDFGLDEFMAFCRLLGTEPYITVNSGLGDAKLAADEVRYANAPADQPGGRQRAANGHSQPYGVKWWSVGNEMYGDWQLGHMPRAGYARKHNQFVEAMRAVDPAIKLIAVGHKGRWSETMLRSCGEHMDLISEHFYCGEKPKSLAAHVRQMSEKVRRIVAAHRDYRQRIGELGGKDIRLAVDEWNYGYGPHLYGEEGKQQHLKDALGIAAALHEFARQSDLVFMANCAQTVNVLGCVKTSKTAAALDTTGLALLLYRRHFGVTPVRVEAAPPLDVAAAWTADGKTLTIGVVNPTRKTLKVPLAVAGAGSAAAAAGGSPAATPWRATSRAKPRG